MTEPSRPRYEEQFRQRLKEARLAADLTQAQLARRATAFGFPVEQPAVARIESGARSIGLDEAAALALAVDLSLVDMIAPDTLPGIGPADRAEERARAIRERENEAQLAALRAQVNEAAANLTNVRALLGQGVQALLDDVAKVEEQQNKRVVSAARYRTVSPRGTGSGKKGTRGGN